MSKIVPIAPQAAPPVAEPVAEPWERLDHAFIAGAWVPFPAQATHTLIDPHTEAVTGELHLAPESLVEEAVASAKEALTSPWADQGKELKLALLRGLMEEMHHERARFAHLISSEIGAPIDFAREHQVNRAFQHLQATLEALKGLENDVPDPVAGPSHRIRYEPAGVAALITPWNWPLNQVVLKVAAALAAGCPSILKPSEWSHRTAALFTDCLRRAAEPLGLPPGLFSLLPGNGEVGAALAAHPDVQVISFTGSTAVGKSLMGLGAEQIKRVNLELGGKSSNILFGDCDLPKALRQGVAHCFRNAGQSCNAASRMLIQSSVYEEAKALIVEEAKAIRLGPPGKAGSHQGPLVNGAQFARVQRFIEEGERTATVLVGGAGRPAGLDHGFYVQPTVFADVAPDSRLFLEEIFGPVLTLTPFDTEAEAVDLANRGPYGLAGYLQTADPQRADWVARRLRVGMVQVNGVSRVSDAPFGGFKQSGIGREGGAWGIRSFQEVKSISGAALSD